MQFFYWFLTHKIWNLETSGVRWSRAIVLCNSEHFSILFLFKFILTPFNHGRYFHREASVYVSDVSWINEPKTKTTCSIPNVEAFLARHRIFLKIHALNNIVNFGIPRCTMHKWNFNPWLWFHNFQSFSICFFSYKQSLFCQISENPHSFRCSYSSIRIDNRNASNRCLLKCARMHGMHQYFTMSWSFVDVIHGFGIQNEDDFQKICRMIWTKPLTFPFEFTEIMFFSVFLFRLSKDLVWW